MSDTPSAEESVLPVCTCTDHTCESCREWFGMDPWPHLA